jgi:long-chain acyl-CoA synthetase
MAGVPTIYDRIKKGARDKIEKSGAVTHSLFKFAYDYKKKALARNEDTPFWNNLVFNKLKAQMGGRIRVMLSGGAPLSQDTQQFLRVCFSCSVIQGYGLTETCGGATIMHVDDPDMGVVGAPLPGLEIKLVDVEEMNYKSTSNPPQGEIWIRGPNVANGYYNDVEQTQKSFIDGWFATGDVGEWTPEGTLKIIDRIKNLIKMAHGEYIALENVESKLKNSPYVENICAYGDGTKVNLVALVVPARHKLLEWAAAKKIPYTDYESLCNDRKARSEVLSSIIAAGRAAKMKTNELPKDVFLCHEEWTPINEMLTAAMKLKRPTLNRHFKAEIDAMYSDE